MKANEKGYQIAIADLKKENGFENITDDEANFIIKHLVNFCDVLAAIILESKLT